jgi:heme-degrading monooxygenase HmoA
MAVKVFIARRFKEGKFNEAYKLLMELRSMATLRTGYQSGVTLISSEDHNKLLVISTWTSEKRWQDWRENKKRKDFTKKLEAFLESPEEVEIYLAGEKHPEWVDMA